MQWQLVEGEGSEGKGGARGRDGVRGARVRGEQGEEMG